MGKEEEEEYVTIDNPHYDYVKKQQKPSASHEDRDSSRSYYEDLLLKIEEALSCIEGSTTSLTLDKQPRFIADGHGSILSYNSQDILGAIQKVLEDNARLKQSIQVGRSTPSLLQLIENVVMKERISLSSTSPRIHVPSSLYRDEEETMHQWMTRCSVGETSSQEEDGFSLASLEYLHRHQLLLSPHRTLSPLREEEEASSYQLGSYAPRTILDRERLQNLPKLAIKPTKHGI
jgi:hypothetical protein